MRSKRIQDIVATRSFPLLVAIVISSLYWLLCPATEACPVAGATLWSTVWGITSGGGWISNLAGWGLCVLTGFVLWAFTVRFALIRVQSTFYLTVYALLMACGVLHVCQPGLVLAVCWLAALFGLFDCYQQNRQVWPVFQGFLFIGLGTLVFPLSWVLLPFLFCLQLSLHMVSLRGFCAGLTGLALPYWFLLGYAAVCDAGRLFAQLGSDAVAFAPIDYTVIKADEWLSLAFITVLSLWSGVHYFIRSYKDKIRTRTYIYYLMSLEVLFLAFGLLQPHYLTMLLPLLVIVCSLLSGHYFAVTRSRASLVAGIVTLVLLLALFVFDVWMR